MTKSEARNRNEASPTTKRYRLYDFPQLIK